MPSSSRATVGITVVTAVASNAANATSANIPTVVAAYAGESRRSRGARSAAELGAVVVTMPNLGLQHGLRSTGFANVFHGGGLVVRSGPPGSPTTGSAASWTDSVRFRRRIGGFHKFPSSGA